MRKNNFSILFLFFGLVGCADLHVISPLPPILEPETLGRDKVSLGGSYISSRNITVTNYAGSRPPNFSNPHAEEFKSIPLEANFGALNFADIGFFIMPLERGGGGRFKFQLLGAPADKPQMGLSLGIFGQATYTSGAKDGDQEDTFGPGGFNWEAEINSVAAMAGGSLGFRFSPSWLVFVGGSYADYEIHAKIKQDPADDLSDPGGTYKYKMTGQARSAGLGVVIGEKHHFGIQAVYSEAFFKALRAYYDLNLALNLSMRF